MNIKNNIFKICFISLGISLMVGCTNKLPFKYAVTSIIPDALKVEGKKLCPECRNHPRATAYAINDFGHVVGIYSPPAPRRGSQIFIYADGNLSRHDYPCSGHLHISSVTNTKLISGYCQPSNNSSNKDIAPYSFVVSYAQPGTLKDVQPAWPIKGFFVVGLNDRGDAIGWNPKDLGGNNGGFLGFIYLNGKLHLISESEIINKNFIRYAKLSSSGLVVGGESTREIIEGEFKLINPFLFKDGEFVELPYESGTVTSINNSGHWVSNGFTLSGYQVTNGFGLHDGQHRKIDCGMEYCSAQSINDSGWLVGNGHTSYGMPPIGGTLGHSYLWINNHFYNIDKSIGKNVNLEYPLMISNKGHIILHSDGWPYLITPENTSRQISY